MRVSKYNASGNDFVIFHTFYSEDRSMLAKRLCDRYDGVGADGLIVLKPHPKGLEWEFYNSDGSVASMCGNGARAAISYAYDNGLCDTKASLITLSGEIKASLSQEGTKSKVEINLGKAKLLESDIKQAGLSWWLVDTGVPHLLSFSDDLEQISKDVLRELRHKFNANTNMASIKNGNIYVRTFERGVEDETLACGTGMAACFFVANKIGLANNNATLIPKSHDKLELSFNSDDEILFKGLVRHCFDAFVK